MNKLGLYRAYSFLHLFIMDVILVSISAIIILLLLGFRKIVNLFLIKIIFGEFSFKYISKFKHYTNKKPHAYCFKDDFFYHILAVKNALKCKIVYKADKVFDFDGLDFNKSFKQILGENGQPDCFTMSNEKEIPLKVAGYKSTMFHSHEKTLHYFCENYYFMGEYVFSSLADDTSKLIIDTMKKEFDIDLEYAKNFAVIDPKGNYLFFTDTGFFLSIKFFNSNNNVIKSIIEFTNDNEEKKANILSTFGGLSC